LESAVMMSARIILIAVIRAALTEFGTTVSSK
jgi:hypothetical protein